MGGLSLFGPSFLDRYRHFCNNAHRPGPEPTNAAETVIVALERQGLRSVEQCSGSHRWKCEVRGPSGNLGLIRRSIAATVALSMLAGICAAIDDYAGEWRSLIFGVVPPLQRWSSGCRSVGPACYTDKGHLGLMTGNKTSTGPQEQAKMRSEVRVRSGQHVPLMGEAGNK